MNTNNVSILVVDDVLIQRQTNVDTLARVGYADIRQARNGIEALSMLKERPAQIVIADWVMPEMDGLSLTKSIREMDILTDHYTAVLLVTSKDGVEHLVEAFEQGVDDYINKPFDPRELVARTYSAERISHLYEKLIASAKELKDDNRRLEREVMTDPLTGAWNRRYIAIHINNLIKLTLTRGGATYCAMVDLDHFKDINDKYGHDIGDEVLQGFCRRMLNTIRPTDILARHGGEEFIILMHHNEKSDSVMSIFERIRQQLIKKPINTSVGDIPLTASFGISVYLGVTDERPLMTASDLINRADKKVYEAKKSGRNCIAI